MKFKSFFITPIRGYQYISKMLPANCRYYPTCSEYAAWQFEVNAPHRALAASALRILRCNQLFTGGIDYPVVTFKPPKRSVLRTPNSNYGIIKVIFWLVPKYELQDHATHYALPATHFYLIKDFDALSNQNHTQHTA